MTFAPLTIKGVFGEIKESPAKTWGFRNTQKPGIKDAEPVVIENFYSSSSSPSSNS